MSKFSKHKIVLFKLAGTYGVDPGATPELNGIQTKDFKWMPMEGSDIDRDLEQAHMGAQGTLAAELHAKVTFGVELAPSGTAGTAPAWGPLLRACGVAETIDPDTSVTYNPVSAGHESGTMAFALDGTQYVSHGIRGNCTLEFSAQGIPYLQFEFTGLFTPPAETPIAAPNLAAFAKPIIVSDANTDFTLAGNADLVLRKLSLDLGNSVETSLLVGQEEVDITDKSETLEMTVRAVSLGVFDPYQYALDKTPVAASLVHGKTAGKIATLAIPAVEIQRPQGVEHVNGKVEWPLRATPLPVVANDQWTLTLT